MDRLKNKVAVITGGASGIGLATVELFIEEGAQVVVGDLQDDKGRELEAKYKDSLAFIHTDVSDEAQVKAMVDLAMSRFGRLDVIFNNAGYGGEGFGVEDITPEGFRKTYDILVLGVMLGMKYAAPIMKAQKSGSMINTASVAGLRTGWSGHNYAGAKAAVTHVSKTVAMELAPDNVRVNSICPGGIATNIFAVSAGLPAQVADATRDAVVKGLEGIQPMPITGEARDIAEAALYLASDASRFMTGHAMVVDGGATLGDPHPDMTAKDNFVGSVFGSIIEAVGPEALEGLAPGEPESETS